MRALPVVGHLPWFWTDTTGFLLRLAQEQGDVAVFRLGRRQAFLLSHPSHVQRVLVDDAAAFRKGRLMQRARRLLGNGLITSEGAAHHAQRRQLQPAFCRGQLSRYGETVAHIAAVSAERWDHGQVLDIGAAMDELTTAIVAQVLFGVDLGRDARLATDLELLARRAPLFAAPLARHLERAGLPPLRAAGRAANRIEAAVLGWVRGRSSAACRDLLSLLRPLPPQLARDEAMTMFLAGRDTTAAALTWTWHLLATHPHVAERLGRELDEVLGGRDPVAGDADALVYTGMVFDETLRLYPPVGRIGRQPLADFTMDGLRIPAESPVFLSPYVTQRDPRWWPDPERFNPDRWTPGAMAERPRYAGFPFGAGPRSCIGGRMARMVGVLVIAAVARRWRMRSVPGPPPQVRGLLTLKPARALHLRLERRGGM